MDEETQRQEEAAEAARQAEEAEKAAAAREGQGADEEEVEAAEGRAEPTTHGHVVQDNVTEPGVERTSYPDGRDDSVHGGEDEEPGEGTGSED